MKLTKREEIILNSIKNFIKENGYSPSIRELCKLSNLKSTASIFDYLRNLRELGYINYIDGKNRTITIKEE